VSLIEQVREFAKAIETQGTRFAVIGGLAVNLHGYLRATHDLDFLIDERDRVAAETALGALGYQLFFATAEVASFARGDHRIDLLFARRPLSRQMLAATTPLTAGELVLPVVSVEDLIGLKLQAYGNDPRRLRDLADIRELLNRHRSALDFGRIAAYAEALEMLDLWEQLRDA
jgi:predicted nucleotidyltransferase